MTGLAAGLFITAAALAAQAQHAQGVRHVLAQARLGHELDTVSQLMVHHLRRAGHWDLAAHNVVRPDGQSVAVNPHPWRPPQDGAVHFSYSRTDEETRQPSPTPVEPAVAPAHEQLAFRWRDGSLHMALGAGRWQPLTDPARLTLTRVELQENVHVQPVQHDCTAGCSGSGETRGNCTHELQVRRVALTLAARDPAVPSITRELHTEVRLRNDELLERCAP